MKRYSTLLVALLSLLFLSPKSYSQHSLQLDDGLQNYSIINASNPGGIYTLPPGGGTLLTSVSLGSLVWITGGNLGSSPNNQLGTLDATDLQFITGGLANTRMVISGTSGFVGIGTPAPNHLLEINGTVDATETDLINSPNWDLAVFGDIASTGIIKSGAGITVNGVSIPHEVSADQPLDVYTDNGDLTLGTGIPLGNNVNLFPERIVHLQSQTPLPGQESILRLHGNLNDPAAGVTFDYGIANGVGELGFIESPNNNFGFYINTDNNPVGGGNFSINFGADHLSGPTPALNLDGSGNTTITGILSSTGLTLSNATSPISLGGGGAGTVGQLLTSAGAGNTPTWIDQSALIISFASLSGGTNTTAAMVVGSGATLDFTGTGTINASSLEGSTWEVPGTIGSTTPNTGSFTALTVSSGLNITGGTLLMGGTSVLDQTRNLFNIGNISLSGSIGTATTVTASGLVSAGGGVNLSAANAPLEVNGSAGSSGQVLTSAGAGNTPTWTNQSALVVNMGGDVNGTSAASTINSANAGIGGRLVASLNASAAANSLNADPLKHDATLTVAGNQIGFNLANANTWGALQTFNAGLTVSGGSVTTPLGLGVVHSSAGGVLSSTTVNLAGGATEVSGVLPIVNGGTNSGTALNNGRVMISTGGQIVERAALTANQLTVGDPANGVHAITPGTVNQVLISNGAGVDPSWTNQSALSIPFSNITGGTNTTAAMVVGSGATLDFTGTGTINASSLEGSTWEVPGTIGSTTPNTGVFTSLVATSGMNVSGGNLLTNGTTRLDGSGNLSNIGNISLSGSIGTATTIDASGLVSAGGGVNLSGANAPLELNGSDGNSGQLLTSAGTGNTPTWTDQSALAVSFSSLTGGTNTTAAMVVGSGATLDFTGTGTINASSLEGSTWEVPGTIGSTTPNTGVFTSLVATSGMNVSGGNLLTNGTTRLDGSGNLSNIGNISLSGSIGTATTIDASGLVSAGGGVNLSGANAPLELNGNDGNSGQLLTSAGTGNTPTWIDQSALIISFASLSGGTNTTAAMVVGSGATLDFTGTGTINASSLEGSTWEVPGTIGSTTPNTGVFTSLVATSGMNVSGGNLLTNGTTRLDGSGNLSNIGNISLSGSIGTATTIDASGIITTAGGLDLSGVNAPLEVSGSAGTLGQILTSNGAGATPSWGDVSTMAWILGGNTAPSSNILGTLDATDLNIVTGSGGPNTRLFISGTTGNIGIGTSTANALLSFGTLQGNPAIFLYDGNAAASNFGIGIAEGGELQNFVPSGADFAWNLGGDLQASGTNELMRLSGVDGSLSNSVGNNPLDQAGNGIAPAGILWQSIGGNPGYTASFHNINPGAGAANNGLLVTTAANDAGTNIITATSNGTDQFKIAGNGVVFMNSLTASTPLRADASKNIVSGAIDVSTSDVTGVLPIANGGTNGTAAPTAGAIAYGTGTAYDFTAAGTAGQVLTSAGAGTPTWTTLPGIQSGTSGAMANAGAVSTVVINATVTAASVIIITVNTPGGAQGFLSTSHAAGANFTVTSTSATETSTIDWVVIN